MRFEIIILFFSLWLLICLQADSWLLEKYPIVTTDELLYSRALGLRFQANTSHFLNNKMELRCVAKIDDYSEWERVVTVWPRDRYMPDSEKPATGRFRNNISEFFICSIYIVG